MIKKTFHIILNDVLAMLSIRKIISIISVFIVMDFITLSIYDINNLNDVFKFTFYGVNSIADMPIEMLKITLCTMFLVYFNLSFSNQEIKGRSSILIIRISSRKLWGNGLIISILILCFLYYLIGFITLGVINYSYLNIYMNFVELINIFCLMCLSSFCICLLSLLISIFINNEAAVFAVILSLYFISIGLGAIAPKLDKYIIFTQGMMIKHDTLMSSFQWSYFYLGIFSLIIYFIVKKRLVEMDI